MRAIKIDGIEYNVPLVSIKRKADVLDKYAERTEDGVLRREVIGVYYNYDMAFGTIDDANTYEALFNKLTEPVAFHEISVPVRNEYYTFTGYISSVSDEYSKVTNEGATFKALTCKFTSQKPTRS